MKMKSLSYIFSVCLSTALFFQINAQDSGTNRAPIFTDSLVEKLTRTGGNGTGGIYENTPDGTVIGVLKAYDPDTPGCTMVFAGSGINFLTVHLNGTVVKNKYVLDREKLPLSDGAKKNTMSIKFFAFDCNVRGLYTATDVAVHIKDVNDVKPEFKGIPYKTNVEENTAVGSAIFNELYIEDDDEWHYAEIVLSCDDGSGDEEAIDACATFRVQGFQEFKDGNALNGRYNGKIFLKRPLDFETKRQYILTVMAKDNPANTSGVQNAVKVNVLVTVTDNQDSPPEFVTAPITIVPDENTPRGEVVGRIDARDTDSGSPRAIKIEIIDSEDQYKMFKLGETLQVGLTDIYRANILVDKSIDYETNPRFSFGVIATELDDNGQKTDATVKTQVIVDVRDMNDYTPSFDVTSYNVRMSESQEAEYKNTRVPGLQMLVNDEDSLTNARFVVKLTDQTYDTFSIPETEFSGQAPVSLLIKNPQYLDYEVPSYRTQIVKIEARQISAPNPLGTSTATVTITLTDLNDNSPVFSNEPYFTSLGENIDVNTKLNLNIQASDKDSGSNSEITFSLEGTGANNVFRINAKTGEVFLNEALNYEDVQQYELFVVATDNGIEKRSSYSNLKVDVLNFNDEAPIFNPPDYKTSIFENSPIFRPQVKVQATHPETKSGDKITYRLVNNPIDKFTINPTTGQLSLLSNLVYMQDGGGKVIELTVEANDNDPNNPQKAETKIYVTLLDVNDHTPQFSQSTYLRTISEATPKDTEVITLAATDGDYGSNKKLRYRIASGSSDHFQIADINIGNITVSQNGALDKDIKSKYTLEVYAIDGGSPSRTGTTFVEIRLTDDNNKDPYFDSPIYLANVDEGLPAMTSVLTVTGQDPDEGNVLRYSIPVNSVSARDENGREFDSIFDFNYKNNTVKPVLGDHCLDRPPVLRDHISQDSFIVDNVTGEIKTNKVLRRREAAEYQFSVMVTDIKGVGPIQTATTSVLITVLSSTEVPLYFVPPWTPTNPEYTRNIRENVPINTKLHTLIAKDPSTRLKINNYSFMGDEDEKYFRLDAVTGDIFVSRNIDYEELPNARLTFRVKATAPSGSGKLRTVIAKMNVLVQDENDNTPVLSQPDGYEFTIPENYEYPATVGTVNARDLDRGKFGTELEYILDGQGASDFNIYNTGVIVVSRTAVLDHETKKDYTLQVTAKDNPSGGVTEVRRQATAPLRIIITDVNDHAPEFSQSEYVIDTVESIPSGTSIGRVEAFDKDSGTNKDIDYILNQVVDREAISLFEIGMNDGKIFTKSGLRGTSINSPYTMEIRAQDRGSPMQYSVATVKIHVTSGQLDDGTPVISKPNIGEIVTTVCENAPGGTFVYDVSATARGENSHVKYSFLTNDEAQDFAKFNITPWTDENTGRVYGRITVANGNITLDREFKEIYQVIIVAEDSNNKTLQSFRQLSIKLCDEDDNIPSFFCEAKQNFYTLEITENEDKNVDRYVYHVSACDDDLPPNNKIEYNFVSDGDKCPNADIGTFKIDKTSGEIRTLKVLDREMKDTYQLCIRASIPGVPGDEQKFNIFNLTIELIDRNDNGPSFKDFYEPDDKKLHIAIYEQPAREEILKLTAFDKDLPPYNRPRFLVSSIYYYNEYDQEVASVPGAFRVHSGTGLITTGMDSYKPFYKGYFKIKIRAEDYYKPSLHEFITVTVRITQPRQRVRVTLKELAENAEDDAYVLLNGFNKNTDGSYFIMDSITYHRNIDSDYDYKRTDICFIVLNRQGANYEYNVLSSYEGTDLLDKKFYQDVIKKVEAVDHGPCDPETTNSFEGWSVLWWVLVAFAIFIFVCTFIFIVVICQLHRNYKDYMRTRKTYLLQQTAGM